MKTYDTVVLGAGAAGLYAAGLSARRGLSVLVIDHSDDPGEKIRISGGGRCNFTNLRTRPEAFLSANPHFAKSALARHTPQDFVALVRKYGISYHEKTLGQLFCDGKATQIVEMLRRELSGAELRLGCGVEEVSARDNRFFLRLTQGPDVRCGNLVVATGGKSIPKMGATGFGYKLAEQFGLGVTETRPGLVPLTFGPEQLAWMGSLSGVSLPLRAEAASKRAPSFDEAALFTHRGLSGPAILQISSYWREGEEISLSLLEGAADWLKDRKHAFPKRSLATILSERLPARLAQHLAQVFATDPKFEAGRIEHVLPKSARIAAERAAPGAKRSQEQTNTSEAAETGRVIGTIPDRGLSEIANFLSDWRLKPTGSEGYRTAEVTLGGVSTKDLDARTMEAKSVPGLYFIGEVVDVTGWLGGYNFQWAWSSAHACAEGLERR